MATVTDSGNYWTLSIYPEAQPVEKINEPDKGYIATLGYDPATDRHLVMTVMYEKSKFAIGDVLKQIEGMKACPKCSALDKARLNEMTIIPKLQPRPMGQLDQIFPQPQSVRSVQPPQAPVRQNVKDMFANALFDAYLTPAGKMMVGNVFGDQELVEESMPRTPGELAQLWDDTTSGKLLRSPGEAKEFMDVIRGEPAPNSPAAKAKQAKQVRNIVIG
ncbi:MAG: hypothetical protein E4G94_02775 [ANME-2 cluster archaeon]|nr:MAG: hypothetical protein E4G94_02775 [ANME-2 cluster archaeon]